MAIVQTGQGLAADSDTGALVVTTDTSGAKWVAGFLVAPSGALVVS